MQFRSLQFTKQDYLDTLVFFTEEMGFSLEEALRVCDLRANSLTVDVD